MFPVFEMVKANNVKLVTRTTAAMQVQETVLPIFWADDKLSRPGLVPRSQAC